ncbi:hypothetical protein MHB77_31635 [Paenibacillus sp. FSL K6-3166]|uniref:hypothetical protein n=1 Tax=Paenibacillus sp. FSL K6-3166 TaxID=2921492 RepID=UPI0030FB8478
MKAIIEKLIGLMIEMGTPFEEIESEGFISYSNVKLILSRDISLDRVHCAGAFPLSTRWPFYSCSIMISGVNGEGSHLFSETPSQQFTDHLANAIEQIKTAYLEEPEFPYQVTQDILFDTIDRYNSKPTFEDYRLKQTLTKHYKVMNKEWRQKKKDKQRKKKNIIDRLMKLKNSLPYSTRKDILAKKGVRLIQLANGLFKADDIQNSQNYYSGYGATRERALHRLENPRRIFSPEEDIHFNNSSQEILDDFDVIEIIVLG